jgi:hypothetical protein
VSGYDDQCLDASEAKRFINSNLKAFCQLETWGAAGVLQQGDIAFAALKRLQPLDMNSFDYRLSRHYDSLDLQFFLEIGKRRARANAVLSRLGASAQLHVISQPCEAFDKFLAVASQQDQMRAHEVASAIIQSSTFPRDSWLGFSGNDQT